jgi:hypothetical protein
MMTLYIIILVAVLAWQGYYAWLRGSKTYRQDRQQHDSLREYLLGNGATKWQSLWPFWRHTLQRAFRPMLKKWQLWLVLLVLGGIVVLIG